MRLTGGTVRAAAAAVLLARTGRARIAAVDERFGDDPAERSETLSVAPLLQLHDWLNKKIATSRNLNLQAADPGGGAARVVVEWPASSS